jgi:hypothetical protein
MSVALLTLEDYIKSGIEPFHYANQEYVRDGGLAPITIVPSHHGNDLGISFSLKLSDLFLKKSRFMEKSYETALKYGFMGFSTGGKNGIFYLRNDDEKLLDETKRIIDREWNELEANDVFLKKPVKIVTHSRKEERVVGAYDGGNGRIHFLDIASYK